MTSPLTDSTLVIADRFYVVLEAAKVSLDIADVFFGDQDNLPHTPALCVEPGVKRRTLFAAQDMTENVIDTILYLYHSEVRATTQQNARRDSVRFAENVEMFLHQNHLRLFSAPPTPQQLTIHGHMTELDPGFAFKRPRTLYNAVRMTWTSLTKTRLQA